MWQVFQTPESKDCQNAKVEWTVKLTRLDKPSFRHWFGASDRIWPWWTLPDQWRTWTCADLDLDANLSPWRTGPSSSYPQSRNVERTDRLERCQPCRRCCFEVRTASCCRSIRWLRRLFHWQTFSHPACTRWHPIQSEWPFGQFWWIPSICQWDQGCSTSSPVEKRLFFEKSQFLFFFY